MKTILNRVAILAFALTSTLLVSCGDETTNNIYIGEELVKLDAQALITNAQSPFQGKNPTFDNSYVHQMPTMQVRILPYLRQELINKRR